MTDDIQSRITWLMKQKPELKTLAGAARAYKINYEVFKKVASHNSSERRNLTMEDAIKIAEYHGVSVGWLYFGEGQPDTQVNVPFDGIITDGQSITVVEAKSTQRMSGDLTGLDARALLVEGDTMRPLARDGDILFVGAPRKDIKELIGEECDVLLEDGRRFFKVIENGAQKGRFDLVAHNAATIRNVEIHSASPLLAIRRRPAKAATAS